MLQHRAAWWRVLASVLAVIVTCLPSAVFAQAMQNMDLASTNRSLTANIANGQTVQVNVGGNAMSVTSSTLLTPAEYLAVQQVMSAGSQAIQIGVNGAAIGGSVALQAIQAQAMHALVIPQNVSVLGDFSQASKISMTGNLVNSGLFYLYSQSAASTVANIAANNIYNMGLISNSLPAAIQAFRNLPANTITSIQLNAEKTITNWGTISSTGDLSLNAGSVINNAQSGTITGNNVSLNSQSGTFTNQGLIQATSGKIAVNSIAPQLNFANIGGILEAKNGAINFGDGTCAGTDGIASILVNGGDLIAKSINLDRPRASLKVDVNSASAPMYFTGSAAEAHVQQGDLNIASIKVDGDPFLTTHGNFSLALSDQNTYDFLNITAGGDITITGPSGATIHTNLNGSNTGSSVQLEAGVDFGGNGIPTGSSATGGSINMSGITIDAPGTQYVYLRADKGTTSGTGGNVSVGGIYTNGADGGAGNFANGDGGAGGNGANGGPVTIEAAGAVNVGIIVTNGGNGGAGIAGTSGANGSNGSKGGDDYSGHDGGNGTAGTNGGNAGHGGNGGNAGAIALSGSSVNVTYLIASGGNGGVGGLGGNGGNGGSGGNGGDANGPFGAGGNGGDGAAAGNAGNGGFGGSGGAAANVTINGGSSTLAYMYLGGGNGGAGGSGGAGGTGGKGGKAGASAGGNGGDGGAGGAGGIGGAGAAAGSAGLGGSLTASLTGAFSSSTQLLVVGGAGAAGGSGGNGGAGGNATNASGGITGGEGADGGNGGAGGNGATGGAGRNGGTISISAASTALVSMYLNGGAAGAGGNGGTGQDAGSAGSGGSGIGGAGGGNGGDGGAAASGQYGGAGGSGGSLSLKATQSISLTGDIFAKGGTGGNGGDGGDGGSGSSGANGGDGLISVGGGEGGNGTGASSGGGGGQGGDGGNIYLTSTNQNISTKNLWTTAGVGGDGGNGGNGGDGGNGAQSGVAVQGYTSVTPTSQSAATATVGFNIGTVGSSGGDGGSGGVGGNAGRGGNGGDITLAAPLGSVSVDGNIYTYGNNSGVQGVAGVSGSNGEDGGTHSYFGLALSIGSANGSLPGLGSVPLLGLGGAITIDNFTVGGLIYYGPWTSGLAPYGLTFYANYKKPDGSTPFSYTFNTDLTSVSMSFNFEGHVYDFGVAGKTWLLHNNPINLFTDAIINLDPDSPYTLSNHTDTSQLASNSTFTSTTNLGSVFTTTNGYGTNSSSTSGGNISITAGSNINVNGVVNALGGQTLSISARTQQVFGGYQTVYTGTYYLGPGGSVVLQAPSITVTGGSSGPSASVPTVSGGSIAFVTTQNSLPILIKPIEFASLTWPTAFGLNVGNGAGYIMATTGVKLIQNQNGGIDLSAIGTGTTTNLFASSSTYSSSPYDVVVLASGNITASSAPNGAAITVGDSSITGHLILAAGDQAATYTYGTANGNQAFLVLGASSSTGGAVNLPSVSLGSSSTSLLWITAHSNTVTGFSSTSTLTTSSSNANPGTIYVVADGDVLVNGGGTSYTSRANLISTAGSVGNTVTPVALNAPYVSALGYTQVQITDSAAEVNLLSSQSSVIGFAVTGGNLNVVQPLSAYYISLTASTGSISLQSSVSTLGNAGAVEITSLGDINSSTGLSRISSPSIFLNSKGNITLSSLSASSTLVLQGSGTSSAVTVATLSAPYVGILSGTGGISIAQTNASTLVANASGDVTIYDTGSVQLGGPTGLYSLGNNFQLTANGSITVSGATQGLSSLSLIAADGSNGSITIGANMIGGTVTFQADGSGSITSTAGIIDATNLVLITENGDIGSPTAPVYTTADNLEFTGNHGFYMFRENFQHTLQFGTTWSGTDFYLINNGSVELGGSLTASNNIAIAITDGYLTVGGTLHASNQIALATDNSTGAGTGQDLTILGSVIATGALTLNSSTGSRVFINDDLLVSASDVYISTPTLHLVGRVQATTGSMTIASNASNHALTLDFVQGSRLVAQQDVTLNTADAPGPITTSVGVGEIVSLTNGFVTFNAGNNPLDISVSSVSGKISGSANTFSFTGSSVSFGTISASNQVILRATEGEIYGYGDIAANNGAGTISLTAPGSIVVEQPHTFNGRLQLNAHYVSVAGSGQLVVSSVSNAETLILTSTQSISAGSITAATIQLSAPAVLNSGIITGSSIDISGTALSLGAVSADNTNGGDGGSITLSATGGLSASRISADGASGGGIHISASSISVGAVSASGTSNSAGYIEMSGSLQSIGDITATAPSGESGNIDLTVSGMLNNVRTNGQVNVNAGNLAMPLDKVITANVVNLSGTSELSLNLNAPYMTVSTSGAAVINNSAAVVYVRESHAGSLTINATSGDLQIVDTISGNEVVLSASGTLTSNVISAGTLNVSAGAGGINIPDTNAANLVFNSPGDVTIAVTNATRIGGVNGLLSTGNNVAIWTQGNMTLTGAVQAADTLSLTANGNSSITQSNGTLSAPHLVLASGSGNIGSQANPIYCDATILEFSTNGSVAISNSNANGNMSLVGWNGTSLYIEEFGDLSVDGDLSASVDLTLIAHGAIHLTRNVAAGSKLALDANGSITVNDGIMASGNEVAITSNSQTHALDVSLGAGSTLRSNNKLSFNLAHAGSITMISQNGNLIGSADGVLFNGGTNAVNVDVSSIGGTAKGSASSFSVTTRSRTLVVSDIAATSATLSATDSGVEIAGPVTTTGLLSVNAPSITIDSASPVEVGSASFVSNAASNELNVVLNSGAEVSASGSVNFNNPGRQGSITMNSQNGIVSVGSGFTINFYGGNGDINVDVDALNGTVTGSASNFNMQTRSSGLTLSSVSANDSLNLTASSVDVNANRTVSANTINIASNSAPRALTVNLGMGSTLQANGDINFNSSNDTGAVTINSGTGSISSSNGIITFNGGTNSVDANTQTMTGRVAGTGSSFSLQVQSGSLTLGMITARGQITLVAPAITVAGGSSVEGEDVQINTSDVDLRDGSTIQSIQNINFNTAMNPAALQMSSQQGSLVAGNTVNFNGGSHAVNVDLTSVTGMVTGTASNFSLTARSGNVSLSSITASSTLNISTTSGDSTVSVKEASTVSGAITTVQTSKLTNSGFIQASSGTTSIQSSDVTVTDTGTVSGADINMQTTNLNNAGTIQANSGNVTVQGGNVSIGNDGAIQSTSGNVTVQGGDITITGTGTITAATSINLHGGALNVVTRQLNGAIDVVGTSVTIKTSGNNLVFSNNVNTSAANGGAIDIAANGGQLQLQDVISNGTGDGNSAGTITLFGLNGITLGEIQANGSNGAAAGSINFTTSGNGVLLVGGETSSNQVRGDVTANGSNGGTIVLQSTGGFQIASGRTIQANGTTGSGGKILLSTYPQGTTNLTVVNNGNIEAKNNASTSGIIGFHSGESKKISLIGTGKLLAGGVVRFGNLDTTTLALAQRPAGDGNLAQSSVLNSFEFNAHLNSFDLVNSGNLTLPKVLNLTNVTGSGANFNATATGNITLGTVISNTKGNKVNPANINLSAGGSIIGNSISADGSNGANGGNITIKANKIELNTISALAASTGKGGTIKGDSGTLNIKKIDVSSVNGKGGSVSLTAGSYAVTGAVNARGGAGGGSVYIRGNTGVFADYINVSDPPFGNAGSIILVSLGVVSVGSLLATAEYGSGGILLVSSPFFSASGIIDLSSQFGGDGFAQINSSSISLANPIIVSRRVAVTNALATAALQGGSLETASIIPGDTVIPTDRTRDRGEQALSSVNKKPHNRVINDCPEEHPEDGLVMNELPELKKGTVLLTPQQDIVVQTAQGNVNVGAGCMVLLVEDGSGLAVCNLADTHYGDVNIERNGARIDVKLGEAFIATTRTEGFDTVNPAGQLAYRNLRPTHFPGTNKAFVAEISLSAAMNNVRMIKTLSAAANPEHRKLSAKLCKNAAIQSMMSHSREPFQCSNSRLSGKSPAVSLR